ncbi:hypothetical protein DFJ77DRAFT_477598 [Powellomyces hirtus]|nr:hypothetical protein DFJ77DRAFT_477598 [Powellomyces hirtus]
MTKSLIKSSTSVASLTAIPSRVTSSFLSMLPPAVSRQISFTYDFLFSSVLLGVGRLLPRLPQPSGDLSGKVAIVTGSNSGIGLQIATELARLNATVYLACRNQTKAQEAVDEIITKVPNATSRVQALSLDTSDLASVRQFAKTWSERTNTRIDILIHNAGIAAAPVNQGYTDDGLELLYATNLLGSFLLTYHLERFLASDARVLLTSSTGQYFGFFAPDFELRSTKNVTEAGFHHRKLPLGIQGGATNEALYSNTKAMQAAFAKRLQRHFDQRGAASGIENRRTAHAFTPGFTRTPIFTKFSSNGLLSDPAFQILKLTTTAATDVDQGAATAVWLASTNDRQVAGAPGTGGGYWDRMQRKMSRADVMSDELLDRFWTRWENDAGIQWR